MVSSSRSWSTSTRKWLLVTALFLVVLVSWSLTTPVGGYPDDAFHFAKTWCDDGLKGFVCSPAGDGVFREVPNSLTDGSPWWEPTGYGKTLGDFDNRYPNLFYAVFGHVVFDDVVASVVLIRILNSLLTVFMVSLAFALSPRVLRIPLIASWLIVGPSLLFYYTSSNHPMAWSNLAASTGWVFSAAIILSTKWRNVSLNVIGLVVCVVMAIGSRAEGQLLVGLFVTLGVAVGTTIRIQERRVQVSEIHRSYRWGGVALLLILVPIAILRFGSLQSRVLLDGLSRALETTSWTKLVETLFLYMQVLGSNPRVSEDPTFGAHFPLSVLILGAVLFIGISSLSVARSLAVLITGVAAFLAPFSMVVDSRGVLFTPPRYLVPFVALFVASLFIGVERQMSRSLKSQWGAVSVALFVAHALALHGAFRPFRIGEGVEWKSNLNMGLKWWWQVGPSPMTAWIMGSLAFGYLTYSLNSLVFKQRTVDA